MGTTFARAPGRATRGKTKTAPTLGFERGGGRELELLKRGPNALDAAGADGFAERAR